MELGIPASQVREMVKQFRKVVSVSGSDRLGFLQGLISNDIERLKNGLMYAALLTPQGKYLFDFFLFERGNAVMVDVASDRSLQLVETLNLYKLRQSVEIAHSDVLVQLGLGKTPPDAFADPRCRSLGWRYYGKSHMHGGDIDWDAIRVEHCIPESGIELQPNATYILEAEFERLNGVDFHKGCFVGQEVTARMKHKLQRKKGLATVSVEGNAPRGAELRSNGRLVGNLFTRSGNKAIAFLRFDRIGDTPLMAGDSVIQLAESGRKPPD